MIEIIKMRDMNVVKLTLRETCLYMKPSTMLFKFKLKHSSRTPKYTLSCASIRIPSTKNLNVLTLLGENCIIDKCDAVDFLRKIYKKSNIECELIVYALDNSINSVKKCTFLLIGSNEVLKIRFEIN